METFGEDDLNGSWLSSGFQTEGPHGQKSLAAELSGRQLVLSFLFFERQGFRVALSVLELAL